MHHNINDASGSVCAGVCVRVCVQTMEREGACVCVCARVSSYYMESEGVCEATFSLSRSAVAAVAAKIRRHYGVCLLFVSRVKQERVCVESAQPLGCVCVCRAQLLEGSSSSSTC